MHTHLSSIVLQHRIAFLFHQNALDSEQAMQSTGATGKAQPVRKTLTTADVASQVVLLTSLQEQGSYK